MNLVPDTHNGGLMFQCGCGRCQRYASDTEYGGITESEAELIGWRLIDNKWNCPFCTGNTNNLFGVFNR